MSENFMEQVNVEMTGYLFKRLAGLLAAEELASILQERGEDSRITFLLEYDGEISLAELAKGPVVAVDGNIYAYAEDNPLDIICTVNGSGRTAEERFRARGPFLYMSTSVRDSVNDMPLEGYLMVRVLYVTP